MWLYVVNNSNRILFTTYICKFISLDGETVYTRDSKFRALSMEVRILFKANLFLIHLKKYFICYTLSIDNKKIIELKI